MIDPEPQVYWYEADGRLANGMFRATLARLRGPFAWTFVGVVPVGFGVGVGTSVRGKSFHGHPADPWAFGLAFGVGYLMLQTIAIVLVVALTVPSQRRKAERLFPAGSVTTVTLGEDALEIERPTGTRLVPYRSVRLVRRFPPYWALITGPLRNELLPLETLPEPAIRFIRARAQGKWPAFPHPSAAASADRTFVVPQGWASRVAAVDLGLGLRGRGFWVRVGIAAVAATVLAVVTTPAGLLLLPAYVLLSVTIRFVLVRRTFAGDLPAGSVATTEFADGGFVSRNTGGVRSIRYDDIRSVTVRGDVTRLTVANVRGHLLIATTLLPDEVIRRT